MSADSADDREAQQPSDDGVIVIDEVSSSASDEDTNQDSSHRFQQQFLNKLNVTTLVVCICLACMIATAVQIGRHNMSSRISSINNDQHHQEANRRSVSNLNVDDDEIIIMNPNKISNPNKMPEQHLTMDNDDILIKVYVTLTPTDSPSLSASTPIIPSPWPSTTAPTELTTTSAPVVSFLPMPITLGQDHWIHEGYGLQVSAGISVKLIAMSGARVPYANGDESFLPYHTYMDGAGIISLPNNDGYVYVSNSETESNVGGGVYGLYFENDGQIVDYKALLTGTTWNCGGGLSPWNTWISCEERPQGQCWQIDPDPASQYHRTPRQTLIGGSSGGRYESVAVDDTNPYKPIFFLTEDHASGALRRFIADGNGWDSLHVGGTITFLYFYDDGSFDWTIDESLGRQSAAQYYPETEGVSYNNGQLYFVTKSRKTLFILDLTNMTYKQEIVGGDLLSGRGSFNSQPDQIVFANIKKKYLYFTEDGGRNPGVFARDELGTYYTIFQGIDGYYLGEEDGDETVGVALTPDRQKLYAGIQDAGLLFEFTRDDGMPFE